MRESELNYRGLRVHGREGFVYISSGVRERTGWEERHRGKTVGEAVAKAAAEPAAKPVAECLSSFYISPLTMDILSQPGSH